LKLIEFVNVFASAIFYITRVCVQVFTYVSQKMLSEGSEKSWDQCRVKLKNLKSQWRYVRDRVPGIEEADMEDENVVRQVMTDCQNRGVSPTCVKHLRYVLFSMLGIRDILVQIWIRIPGSILLTNGSGSNSGSDSFLPWL
jgi:hypothetical protein